MSIGEHETGVPQDAADFQAPSADADTAAESKMEGDYNLANPEEMRLYFQLLVGNRALSVIDRAIEKHHLDISKCREILTPLVQSGIDGSREAIKRHRDYQEEARTNPHRGNDHIPYGHEPSTQIRVEEGRIADLEEFAQKHQLEVK